jgi:hypothetical protein
VLTSAHNPIHYADNSVSAVLMLAVLIIVQLFVLLPCSGNLPAHDAKHYASAIGNSSTDQAKNMEKAD